MRFSERKIKEGDILASSIKTRISMEKRIVPKNKPDNVFKLTQGDYLPRPGTVLDSLISPIRNKMYSTPLSEIKR